MSTDLDRLAEILTERHKALSGYEWITPEEERVAKCGLFWLKEVVEAIHQVRREQEADCAPTEQGGA